MHMVNKVSHQAVMLDAKRSPFTNKPSPRSNGLRRLTDELSAVGCRTQLTQVTEDLQDPGAVYRPNIGAWQAFSRQKAHIAAM
jgi:hypothetical protein